MFVLLGTVWPLIGIVIALSIAMAIPPGSWRWVCLTLGPAFVIASHYLFVLPHVLADGNLLAAVIFGLMIGFGVLYYPILLIVAVLAWLRRNKTQ